MNAPDIAKTACYSAGALALLAMGWTALMLGHRAAYSLARLDRLTADANATLTEINRPCKGETCGTLGEVNKAVVHLGDITVAVQKQAQDSGQMFAKYGKTLDGVAADVHGEMLDAQQLTASLTETSRQAATDLRTMNTTIAAAQPVLENASLATGHLDKLITDPDLTRILSAAADTTVHTDNVITTFDKVTAKAAAPYLNPPPKHWWSYIKPTWQTLWQAAMLAK